MPAQEELNHDLLLVIAVALTILFATGLAGPSITPGTPVVFP